MILAFDEQISRMEVHANGGELATLLGKDRDANGNRVYAYPNEMSQHVVTFEDPVLITDYHRIGELGDDDPTLRDTVAALYGTRWRTTRYGTTQIEFQQSRFPGVWGPSIDTLLVCRALRNMDMSDTKTFIEIGAGSGFISKFLLEHFETLERGTMVDMMPASIECCQASIHDDRARFYTGDGLEFLETARADLVLSNPPYIPRPRAIDDNPYEGVSLLVEMIEKADAYLNPGGSLILNLSSLCRSIADEAIERAGLRAEVLDRMTVPLKVYNVLNNPVWLNYLVEEKGMAPNRRQGYDYWHDLEIVRLTRSA